MAYQIQKMLTKYNFTDRNDTGRVEYLVIHYYGALGSALANAKYYAEAYRGASAHYFVDEKPIVYQSVEDGDISWHCGTKYKYYHPKCRNSNSIGIEVRPHKIVTKKPLVAEDRDWYFKEETINTLVELTQDLMNKYNIPKENVIRHYDVTHKLCPRPYVGDDVNNYHNKTGNQMWLEFKSRLKEPNSNNTTETSDNKPVNPFKVGDTVKLSPDVKQYNGIIIPESYRKKEYTVKEIKGDRVVLSISSTIMYAVHIKYLVAVDKKEVTNVSNEYKVQVTADALNYRSGPGSSYPINGTIRDKGVYTIVETNGSWGKLKSGAGWIHLGYTKKI